MNRNKSLEDQEIILNSTGFESELNHTKDDLLSIQSKTSGKLLALSYKVPLYMTSAAFQYMFDERGNSYWMLMTIFRM